MLLQLLARSSEQMDKSYRPDVQVYERGLKRSRDPLYAWWCSKPTGTKGVSIVDLSTFVVSVFCLADDWLKRQPPLRRRGPTPELSDAEVITVEVVGEFLGIDTDSGIHRYFSTHFGEWFPALGRVHRTTFARQAANLWAAKERLWHHLCSCAEASVAGEHEEHVV